MLDLKKILSEGRIGLLKTLWVWMIFVGIICLIVSYILISGDKEHASRLFETIGIAILVGGVFDVVLKSVAYTDIFRDELTKIIYDTPFLATRKDIVEVWKKVSRVLYLSRFPQISDQIENRILDTYFPAGVNFHYEGFSQSLDIQFQDPTLKYIVVTETVEFSVKPVGKDEEVVLSYQSLISKIPSCVVTNYELIGLDINNVDRKEDFPPDCEPNDDQGKIYKVMLSIRLRGEEEYKVVMRHEKIYSPDIDNTKVFSATRFMNSLELFVTYPKELDIKFYPMGTPGDYRDLPGNSQTVIRKKFDDLIFPNQGYRLLMYRRSAR
jgi:hypothetical protein